MTLTDENRPFIRMLLPFWVNGTLRGYDATVVQSALATDAELRAEVEMLKVLRSGMKDLPAEASPGVFGLARLERAIAADSIAPRRSFGPLAAAAAVVVAALGAYVFVPGMQKGDGVFQQASGPEAAAVVTISFHDSATEAAMARVLLPMILSSSTGRRRWASIG